MLKKKEWKGRGKTRKQTEKEVNDPITRMKTEEKKQQSINESRSYEKCLELLPKQACNRYFIEHWETDETK